MDESIKEYLRRIGAKGGKAVAGTPQAKERAAKARWVKPKKEKKESNTKNENRNKMNATDIVIGIANDYIRRDMQSDARTHSWSHGTYYPASFTHEVSDEYSAHWNGPMIYDAINVYSEVQERHGRLHRAMTRLTVGYTVENGVPTIYALTLKVL